MPYVNINVIRNAGYYDIDWIELFISELLNTVRNVWATKRRNKSSTTNPT
jgi:hypothetical protein